MWTGGGAGGGQRVGCCGMGGIVLCAVVWGSRGDGCRVGGLARVCLRVEVRSRVAWCGVGGGRRGVWGW